MVHQQLSTIKNTNPNSISIQKQPKHCCCLGCGYGVIGYDVYFTGFSNPGMARNCTSNTKVEYGRMMSDL